MTAAYAEKLLIIDDAMVALGRPLPPVMGLWLRAASKTMPPRGRWLAACAQWRAELEAWETANPEAAIEWHELRERFRAEEEILERAKWDAEEFNFQLLQRVGAPEMAVSAIRGRLDDRACIRETRAWAKDGMLWSLVLCGGPGCGKTTAAAWAAHQMLMRSYRPKWVRCSAAVDAPLFGVEAQLFKHQCRNAGVLVLDDIGAGAREADAKAWLGWLDDVLDARWGNKRKTIITSNKTPGQLAAWLGLRLADRLNEGTIFGTSDKSMRMPREPGSEG